MVEMRLGSLEPSAAEIDSAKCSNAYTAITKTIQWCIIYLKEECVTLTFISMLSTQ